MHGGDPTRHRTRADLDELLGGAERPPRDHGRVALLVARGPSEARATPGAVALTRDGPLPGDRWSMSRDPERGSQLTAMEHGVGAAIANGQDLALFGDNLVLDLALDAGNLPVGSLVRVGRALLQVTEEPHTGCKKYAARFGIDALAWISARERKSLRLRGIHFRVVEPGRVAVGDPVEVVRRGDGVQASLFG